MADVSNVLEQYTSAKDQTSTKQRMVEMGRTFRGMIASRISAKKIGGDKNIVGLATQPEGQAGASTPDWAADLVEEEVDVSMMTAPNVAASSNDPCDDVGAMPGGEKDPQLFYNEAVAAVAAAAAPRANDDAGYEAQKTKKKTFKSPFPRKPKKSKTDSMENAAEEEIVESNHDVIANQSNLVGDVRFDFPDLLPAEGAKEKKSPKKFVIKLSISKKKEGEIPMEQVEENPFQPNDAPIQQLVRKTMPSTFPDNLHGAVPEGPPGESPPPPVLEIATGPEDDDDDIINPNTTDVDHLVRGLQSTVGDPRLARKFLISLRTMSIHHPNRLGIAEAGGILAIVICMNRFKRESSVAKQGCAALQNLVCADKNEQRSVEEGALDAIVRAMMNHSRSPGTQEHGAAALRNLTAGSHANRTAVIEAGGIEALIKAMKTHQRSADVQDKCCAALANICNKHRANRIAIGEAGGIPCVIQALRKHGYRNKSVAEKGIRCLLNLSHTSRHVEIMKWEEGIEGLVLGLAHRHGGRCKNWALKIFLKM